MKAVSVVEARYIGDYKLEVVFNDDKKQVVDFELFLKEHSHPQYNRFKRAENFRRFRIENGNIVWGRDWDMIFPVWDLYNGKIA